MRLTQILVNLLGNAFKFTREGSVKLSVEKSKQENGDITLRFTVSGTVIGIAADKQTHIFERFGQASADTTRRFGGARLGLGQLALDKLREQVYDLVLMDIQMPVMDGYTTAQHIRQQLHLDVPIIATTAHVFAGEQEKCISYGMNDYISKPIKEDELMALINRYVRKEKKRKSFDSMGPSSTTDPVGFDRENIQSY